MDGPENKLVMVDIQNGNRYIFYGSHHIFCDSNFVASFTVHGMMHGGEHVVWSLMVMENGRLGLLTHFFMSPVILPR